MGQSRILHTNRLLTAPGLTAGAAVAGLDIAGIQGQHGSPSTGWQTPLGVLSASTGGYFVADAGTSQTWDIAGLFRTNLTSAAKIRTIVADDPAGVADIAPDLDLDFTPSFTPPAGWSFSRADLAAAASATVATYWDASGKLQSAAPNTLRIDHAPGSGILRGALIEGQRLNWVKGSRCTGTPGTPGTLPTGWATGSPAGLTRQVVASGTDAVSNLPYIEVRFSGTPASSGQIVMWFTGNTDVPGTVGEFWTQSAFIAGSFLGATGYYHVIIERDGGGAYLGQGASAPTLPTNGPLSGQRTVYTRTVAAAGAVYVQPSLQINVTSGVYCDITLRIAAPQFEEASWVSSPIIAPAGNPQVCTRAADVAKVTAASFLVDNGEGTIATDFYHLPSPPGINRGFWGLTDTGGTTNRIIQFIVSDLGTARQTTASVTVQPGNTTGVVSNALNHTVLAWDAGTNRLLTSINGSNTTYATPGAIPAAASFTDGLRVGGFANGASNYFGHIRRLRYWPQRFADSICASLSRAGTTPDTAAMVYDSGWQTGIQPGYQQYICVLPGAMGRYLRIEIEDPICPDRFLNIPLAAAGQTVLARGITAQSAVGRVSNEAIAVSRAGAEFVTQYATARQFTFAYSALPEAAVWGDIAAMMEVSRLGGNLLFCPDDAAASSLSRTAIFGRLRVVSDIEFESGDTTLRSWRATIVERA